MFADLEQEHGNVVPREPEAYPISISNAPPPVQPISNDDLDNQSILAEAKMLGKKAKGEMKAEPRAWNGVSALSEDFGVATPPQQRPRVQFDEARNKEDTPQTEDANLSMLHFPVRPPAKGAAVGPAPWGGIASSISATEHDRVESPETARVRARVHALPVELGGDANAKPDDAKEAATEPVEGTGSLPLEALVAAHGAASRGRSSSESALPTNWGGLAHSLGHNDFLVPSPSPPKRRAVPEVPAEREAAKPVKEDYVAEHAHAKPSPKMARTNEGKTTGSFFDFSPLSSGIA